MFVPVILNIHEFLPAKAVFRRIATTSSLVEQGGYYAGVAESCRSFGMRLPGQSFTEDGRVMAGNGFLSE
jgi:hypothetical protein